MKNLIIIPVLALLLNSCAEKPKETLFEALPSAKTGIAFENTLEHNNDFNVYTYRNFYNGGGVALGDINGDGFVDIYFTANQQPNKLYLNNGDFTFTDISEKAGVAGTKAWSTGVTMVDINADGLLDIYVCNSGDVQGDNKQNELFINQGNQTFTEEAAAYGLADNGYSTHASFFDFDKDGDLDVYLLNNSYQAIGSFNLKKNERPKRDILGGDKLMENQNGVFVDISEKAGIYGSVIGFGLGVTVGDMNNDTWQDIYVSNDFFERDYLYINQKDGTFKETLEDEIRSISGASMGADVADINNDGNSDIFITEMLPSDYERLKTVTTFEDWNKYQYNVKNGYYHQFTRNMLQLNNGNNTFSEIGRFSGVEASDWSWGALFFDMDNDGLKDLFIANGIYRDLTNQDYLQYISNQEIVRSMVTDNKVDYDRLIEIIPSNKVPNHLYKNKGDLSFERDYSSGLNTPSFSNGAAYGDLDNDGDLDLVVNNVNMPAFVYKNHSNEKKGKHYLKLHLKGAEKNTQAVGAKIKITDATQAYYLEQQPTRGFQSSVDLRPNFGLPTNNPVNVHVTWPSGKITDLQNIAVDQLLTLAETEAKDATSAAANNKSTVFTETTLTTPISHQENRFVDFHRDRLLNHMLSTEGPKISVADVNNDGLDDFFIGGAKNSPGQLVLSSATGFNTTTQNAFELDKASEDMGSLFFDADNDGDQDLYVCSGGVEFSQFSSSLSDRLYFNDGKGNFTKSVQQLPESGVFHSTSTVQAADIDGDGDLDLFVGERSLPNKYGIATSGFILTNDGKGSFTNTTSTTAADLIGLGLITDARFVDFNDDKQPDLVVVGEYMGIEFFENNNGIFNKKETPLAKEKGWWNTLETADIDGDGDEDLIIGNHGKNSRFKASTTQPIKMYVNDFDANGYIDPILTFTTDDGKEFPYVLRHNLIDQLSSLKKKFPDFESFKTATITDIFSPEQLKASRVEQITNLSSIVVVNNGDFNFTFSPLPTTAQFSPIYAIFANDFDADGDQDLLLGGNLYGTKPEVGRYDASFGLYLENQGNGIFLPKNNGDGFKVDGEIRSIKAINKTIIVARNNATMKQFTY